MPRTVKWFRGGSKPRAWFFTGPSPMGRRAFVSLSKPLLRRKVVSRLDVVEVRPP